MIGISLREKISKFFTYTILVITAIFVLYPVIWIITGSLNPGDSLFSTSLIPDSLSLKHYVYLFNETDYLNWYKNTLKIALDRKSVV